MESPLAYFITFHTYGTWLPGDARGSVDPRHRGHGTPYADDSPGRFAWSAHRMRQGSIELSPEERTIVLQTVQEVCRHRGWRLAAAHVRVNHVHLVVHAGNQIPVRVMNDLKAWTTRRVIEAGLRPVGTRLWVRHGSTRYVWNEASLAAASAYVLQDQGADTRWAIGAGV